MSRSAGRKQQNIDHNTADNVEVLSYAEQLEEYFLSFYEQLNVAEMTKKEKYNAIDAIFYKIYPLLFKPDTPQMNNCRSKLRTYDIQTIESVLDKYIELCKIYGGYVKHITFCKLIGITFSCIDNWHRKNNTDGYIFTLNQNESDEENRSQYIYIDNIDDIDNLNKPNWMIEGDRLSRQRFDVYKKIQEELQAYNDNALASSDNGNIVLANNSVEVGRLYEPRRMIQQEQIKQALSLNDLKLLDNSTNNTNNLLLDINGTDVCTTTGEE